MMTHPFEPLFFFFFFSPRPPTLEGVAPSFSAVGKPETFLKTFYGDPFRVISLRLKEGKKFFLWFFPPPFIPPRAFTSPPLAKGLPLFFSFQGFVYPSFHLGNNLPSLFPGRTPLEEPTPPSPGRLFVREPFPFV